MKKSNIVDEVDLKVLALMIWNNKAILIFFFVVSLICSVYTISREDVIYRVEAVVDFGSNKNQQDIGRMDLSGLPINASFLNFIGEKKTDKIPQFLGNEFLGSLVKESDIREKLKRFCVSSLPGPKSLTGILQHFGFMRSTPVFKGSQEDQILIACMQKTLEIGEYRYNNNKTSATTIGLNHSDPNEGSALLNETIDFFFQYENKKNIASFRKSLNFLSEMLAEAELRQKKAKASAEEYMLKNPEVRSEILALGEVTNPNSVRTDIITNQNLSDLSFIDKRIFGINENIEYIDSLLNAKNPETLVKLLKDSYLNPLLSSQLLANLKSFLNSSIGSEEQFTQINILLKDEKKLLVTLLETFEKNRKEKKLQVSQSLQMKEKLESLELEFMKDKAYVESIKNAIQEKALSIDFEGVIENAIYSRASPSLLPIEPKPKRTFVLYAIASIFIGILFIFILQSFRKTIYHENQIRQKVSNIDVTRLSKFRELSTKNIIKGETIIPATGFSLLSKLNSVGEKGSIIQLGSNSITYRDIGLKVSLFISNLLLGNGSNTLLVSKPNSFVSKLLVLKEKSSKIRIADIAKENSKKKYVNFADDFKFSQDEPNKFSVYENEKYEKTIVFPGNEMMDFENFQIIRNTDFFVIIFTLGNVREIDVMKFVSSESPLKEKCAGIVVVG